MFIITQTLQIQAVCLYTSNLYGQIIFCSCPSSNQFSNDTKVIQLCLFLPR